MTPRCLTHTTPSGILRAMSTDQRASADQNLTEAAARLQLADPRPAFRERLRVLKEEHPEAFARALRHYDETVLPALAAGGDAMAAWVRYGETLGGLTAPGRTVTVDRDGRATKFVPPLAPGSLVLHVPDENGLPVLVAAAPLAPSAAQQATLDLLVNRKLAL